MFLNFSELEELAKIQRQQQCSKLYENLHLKLSQLVNDLEDHSRSLEICRYLISLIRLSVSLL